MQARARSGWLLAALSALLFTAPAARGQAAAEPKPNPEVEALRKQVEALKKELAEERANTRKAREALDQIILRIGQEPLGDAPRMEAVRRKLLEDALKFYEAVPDKVDTEASQQEVARAYLRIGKIHQLLGKHAEAQKAYREAVALLNKLVAEAPREPSHQQELARGLHDLGSLLSEVGRLAEAMESHRLAMAIQTKLVADFPDKPVHRRDLADGYRILTRLLVNVGRLEEAEASCRKALELIEKLVADFPKVADYQAALADNYQLLGNLFKATRRQAEAEAAFKKAQSIRERLKGDSPGRPEKR